MICVHCRGSLSSWVLGGLSCGNCGLVHHDDGRADGWPVRVGRVLAGMVPHETLVPHLEGRTLRLTDAPLLVLTAALIGFTDVDAVREASEARDCDDQEPEPALGLAV